MRYVNKADINNKKLSELPIRQGCTPTSYGCACLGTCVQIVGHIPREDYEDLIEYYELYQQHHRISDAEFKENISNELSKHCKLSLDDYKPPTQIWPVFNDEIDYKEWTEKWQLEIKNTAVTPLKMPLSYEWNPQENITTYELAKCVGILLGINNLFYEDDERFKESFVRHFKFTKYGK